MTRYVLRTGVKYRREGFGGVAVHVPSQAAHFYNRSGARVLEACVTPAGEPELEALVGDRFAGPLRDFLDACTAAGLLTIEAGGAPARTFFLGERAFPEKAFFTPLAVEIETTMKCYRACTYCAYESGLHAASAPRLPRAAWEAILDELAAEGVLYLHFTGGDPLTREDFPELLRAADRRDFVITVSSDLTVLDDDHVQALAATRNLYGVQTTLDGASPASADRERGKGSFSRVTRGLRMLQRAGVPVTVGTIVTKRNVDEIAAIARYLRDFDVQGYCIAPLYAAGRGRDLVELVPDNRELARAVRGLREAVLAGDVVPADPAWWAIVEGLDETELDHLVDDQPYLARQPDRVLRIDALGNCYSSIKLKELLRDDVFTGNIRTDSLREIWQGAPLMQRLRSLPSEDSHFGNVVDLRKVDLRRSTTNALDRTTA